MKLGKRWSYRYEVGDPNVPGNNDHMHLFSKGQEYSQNKDGSPKDKPKGGSGPPKKIKKLLKEKTGWDWDAKEKEWLDKIEIHSAEAGDFIIVYPNGEERHTGFVVMGMLPLLPTDEVIIDKYFEEQNVNISVLEVGNIYIAYPQPVPIPQIIPSPTYIPVFP